MANEPKDRIGSEKHAIGMADFSSFDSDVTCARNYRPSFHENKPKTLVLYD
jgi:hypothetical protein